MKNHEKSLHRLPYILLLCWLPFQQAAAGYENTCRKQTGLEQGCSVALDGVDPARARGTYQLAHVHLGHHEPLLYMLDRFGNPDVCSILTDPSANLTLFLPPASQLSRLEAAFNGGLVTLEELQCILSLHIIPQHLTDRHLRSMDGQTLTTAGAGMLEVHSNAGSGDLTLTAGGSTAYVFATNIASCAPGTIVHEVESVLSKHSDWRWYSVPQGDESEEEAGEREHNRLTCILWATLTVVPLTACVVLASCSGVFASDTNRRSDANRRSERQPQLPVHDSDHLPSKADSHVAPLPEVLFRRGAHLWCSVPPKQRACTSSAPPSESHQTAEVQSVMESGFDRECDAGADTEELDSGFSLNMRTPAISCVICFEKVGDHVFIPCGHGGYCRACAEVVFDRSPKQCPLCRQKLHAIMKVALDTAVGGTCAPCTVRTIESSSSPVSLRVSADSSGSGQTTHSGDTQ